MHHNILSIDIATFIRDILVTHTAKFVLMMTHEDTDQAALTVHCHSCVLADRLKCALSLNLYYTFITLHVSGLNT